MDEPQVTPKRALVLSGGGAKGAYEAGALLQLMGEEKRDYDILCGTSVGAINAAYLAQTPLGSPGAAIDKLLDMWCAVGPEKVYKRWFPFGALSALWKPSVYDSRPLQDWIRSGLSPADIRTSGRKLRVVAVSLKTGESYVA